MSRYFSALSILLLTVMVGHAAPRILRSSNPGGEAIWLSLRKESKGQYVLLISREKQPAQTFKLTADSAGGNVLKFTTGEEARATAALKDQQDVIAHTPANDGEAAGDAAGDINTFINSVVRKDGVEGVMILPAAASAAPSESSGGIPGWAYALVGLLAGAAGGYLIPKRTQTTNEQIVTDEEEAADPLPDHTGATVNDALQSAEQLKKAQKSLKEAKAALTAANKKATAEAQKNADLEEDYKALEARLKTANENIAALHQQAGALQAQLGPLQESATRYDAYFKTAAANLVRPFTDFASGNKINPADPLSRAIVEEQLVLMAFHYYSLVRYGAGIWDEHDIYNLQRNSGLGVDSNAASPQPVPISIKSGYPNLVLTVAELLRQSGATGAGMDISIRGYRFIQD